MNYFELHVGDYEAATAHLSMLEDAAYGRMLRVYYRTEKPLPADVKQVCRLVRAQSKPERDAVQAVLDEFFELQADGWHQARADAELHRFRDSEPERELRKANEETRLKRHREERAALFRLLNENGQHAPWNVKIEELRRLAEPFKAAPETPPETFVPPLQATAPATPATATHGNVSPPPTTHLPEKEKPPVAPQGAKSAEPTLQTDSGAAGKPGTPTIPCPYQAIVDRYHARLPDLPRVKLMPASRQRAMRKVWGWVLSSTKSDGARRATTAEEALAWLDGYFLRASQNDFLMGRTPRPAEHANWRCDLDFLLTDKGMRQVIEKTVEAAA
jgi:uncharacterized protein YdaU (DUF1376 family)